MRLCTSYPEKKKKKKDMMEKRNHYYQKRNRKTVQSHGTYYPADLRYIIKLKYHYKKKILYSYEKFEVIKRQVNA